MKIRVLRCVLTALVAVFYAGTVLSTDLYLPGGEKVQGEAQGNRLLLMTDKGQVPAPDGQYRLADGRVINVRGGVILPGMEAPGASRAIGPKPDDPLQQRQPGAVQPRAMPMPMAPPPMPAINGNVPGPRVQMPGGGSAAPGFTAMQPVQMQMPPPSAMNKGALPPAANSQLPLDPNNRQPPASAGGVPASPLSNSAPPLPGLAKPILTAPTTQTAALRSIADPATQLAAAREQNKRIRAMVEDLKKRIANRKDDRQLFCSDYEISSNKQGQSRYCSPYACNMDTGACATSATASDQCGIGKLWDGGSSCIAPPPPNPDGSGVL
jgi:hypothetical protein